MHRPATGTVTAFDDDRGLGTVDVDGAGELPFHCTAVADGSRHAEVGTRVTFVVVPGRCGRWEARGLTPVAGEVRGRAGGR
jgi:cold shock CspA family protein